MTGHPPTNRNDNVNNNKAKRAPATTTGLETREQAQHLTPTTASTCLQDGSGANSHVHHPMNATHAYHTVSLAKEVAVLFFLAHAATIYKGAAFIFYICCLS
jgi:hypothetical protein